MSLSHTPTTGTKPRLLDLFCKAGGAAMGYHWAGFEVIGVDIEPQPRYPFEFIQADALTFPLDGYQVIHASPPCQKWTRADKLREAQGSKQNAIDSLTPTRERLQGRLYVIENVQGAPLTTPLILCGSSFGLKVRRHRLFESPFLMLAPPCRHDAQGRPVGVYHRLRDSLPNGGQTARTLQEAQEAMGIDWMRWPELREAIPPAYTEYIGRQLMAVLS